MYCVLLVEVRVTGISHCDAVEIARGVSFTVKTSGVPRPWSYTTNAPEPDAVTLTTLAADMLKTVEVAVIVTGKLLEFADMINIGFGLSE